METRASLPNVITDDPKVYNTFFHKKENAKKVFAHLKSLFDNAKRENLPIENQLEELGKLPGFLLIFLLVEIEKIRKEQGCFKYEEREPGCIKAFFEGMKTVFELGMNAPAQLLASHEAFKVLQKQITDVDKVNMEIITASTSGEYRTNMYEYIELDVFSPDGLAELIKMIKDNEMSSLMIGDSDVYGEKSKVFKKALLYESSAMLLNEIQSIETETEEKMFKSLALFYGEDLTQSQTELNFTRVNLRFILAVQAKNLLSTEADNETRRILKEFNHVVTEEDYYLIFKYLKNNANIPVISKILSSIVNDFKKDSQEYYQIFLKPDDRLIGYNSFSTIIQKYNSDDPKVIAQLLYKHLVTTKQNLVIQFPNKDFIHALMEKNIKSFQTGYNAILDKSEDERFAFLYKHAKIFLLIHPFLDANNRVFVNALLPLWHMQLRLPEIPMFYNPFVFYSYSVPEIVDAAKLACSNTMLAKGYAQKPKSSLFAFGNKKLSPEQLEQMETFIAPFREVIAEASVRLIVKQMTTAFDSYVKSMQTQLQMFVPSHPDQEVLTKDLPQMKSCKNVKALITLLGTKEKEHQEKNPTLAEFYGKLIEHLQPKPSSTMTP